MENEKILQQYSDEEKGAYLGAIASIATADRQASEQEMQYLDALADTAGLSTEQKEAVEQIAQGISPDDLKRCLDILKSSDLKYSFITDVIAFAKSDASYSDAEKNNIDNMAQYLGVNGEQVGALHRLVDTAAEGGHTAEELSQPGFLDKLGLGSIFKGSGGSNTGTQGSGMLNNIIGMAGPMILGALLSRGLSGRHGSGGGGLGGMLSGGGGLGGMLGGMLGGGSGSMGNMGGLGGLFSGLSGGGGFRNAGGLLSGIFGR